MDQHDAELSGPRLGVLLEPVMLECRSGESLDTMGSRHDQQYRLGIVGADGRHVDRELFTVDAP